MKFFNLDIVRDLIAALRENAAATRALSAVIAADDLINEEPVKTPEKFEADSTVTIQRRRPS